MTVDWTRHASGEALTRSLADILADTARAAVAARGQALLVLAGGSTPLPAYRLFAHASIDWPSTCIVPSDERWVGPDHAHSNHAQLAGCLDGATGVEILPLVPAAPGAQADTRQALEALQALDSRAFDLVVLGMGTDGHIASLFPGTDALAEANTQSDTPPAIVVHPEPLPAEAPHVRVSLSLPRLLRSRRNLLVVRGEAKRTLLESVIAGGQPQLPVATWFDQAHPGVEIHWSP